MALWDEHNGPVPEFQICPSCGRKTMKRDHITEDYLFKRCGSCGDEQLLHFGEMTDEDWRWVKEKMRSGRA